MAYRLGEDEAAIAGIQRVLEQQVSRAIASIDDDDLTRSEAVHDVRKRCKKIRAALRLIRTEHAALYRLENSWYRDCARRLSALRDAHVNLKTLKRLGACKDSNELTDILAFTADCLREHQCLDAAAHSQVIPRLVAARIDLQTGRERLGQWQAPKVGPCADNQMLVTGLRKTYARARSAMRLTFRRPEDEHIHQWRKRVKYHYHHLRLLQRSWPGPMRARAREAHRLSRLLGEDHDLATLEVALLQVTNGTADQRWPIAPLLALIQHRQQSLRATARPLGARLFTEPPRRFGERIGRYQRALPICSP
ncbi:MAG: CHAD domain-containing protein [Gammaproteobacteria bacterium]|nr:CHAD domain-containing protein [Gammaproteobacteria bacterium]